MRKNSVFILLLVALLSLPAFALADSSTDELSGGKGVGWQGIITSGDDAGLYGAAGRARNKYNMACWVMGKNPLTIADEVRSRLSDPNYGGLFYEYANTFESIPSWEYVPEWQPTYANLTYVLYGFDFQWESAVPQSLYEGAKEDFRRVLAGEDLSGGGEPSTPDGSLPSSFVLDNRSGSLYVNYQAKPMSNYTVNVTLSSTAISKASNYIGSNPYYYPVMCYYNPTKKVQFKLFLTNKPVSFSYGSHNGRTTVVLASKDGGSFNYRYLQMKDVDLTSVLSGSSINISVGSWWTTGATGTVSSYSAIEGEGVAYADPWSTPVVVPPSGDWPEPETPVMPTAPEVPTPTAPTVTPDPTPTEPTPTWPDNPTPTAPIVVTVETPEGLDYTQLLTLINDNLNDINSYTVAINSSLNSLRSDLVTEFDGVTQGLRNIYQYLQHLDDLLERHCKHLRDALDDGIYNLELYIKSLFEWLPQQLEFDAKFDYDDTAVTSLLRRILGKIPGGSGDAPTSYMPNPQADEPGFFDWLLDLWHRFLIDLVSVLPDELGGLVDAFSQLTHYFPFSIPWDLAALLALFEHEPVTPVFDVPWGFGGDEGEIEMVRVDLSPWDGVMEMIRPVFLVGFCWQLAMITKDLLANFDINKGGV